MRLFGFVLALLAAVHAVQAATMPYGPACEMPASSTGHAGHDVAQADAGCDPACAACAVCHSAAASAHAGGLDRVPAAALAWRPACTWHGAFVDPMHHPPRG